MALVYLTFFLLWLLLPDLACAWGPGTHLDIATQVLQHAAWVTPAIYKIITAYPQEYIYGNMAADIMVGKKFAGAMHHCHNWAVGKMVLDEAATEAEQASAWGYLTHLAADCVAHNYVVPYKMMESYSNPLVSHIYWEMRFDLFVPEKAWKELRHVIRHEGHPFDLLLERVLRKTLFSFKASKRIYNGILIVQKMRQLRQGLKVYEKFSRWELPQKEMKYYRDLALTTVSDFLLHPEQACCLAADPSGLRKLTYATDMRFHLRRAKQDKVSNYLITAKKCLEEGVFKPEKILPHF